MSEKAILLNALPVVEKSEPAKDDSPILTVVSPVADAEAEEAAPLLTVDQSLSADEDEATSATLVIDPSVSTSTDSEGSAAVSAVPTVASQGVAEDAEGGAGVQTAVYVSFGFIFCLVAFAALYFSRKAAKTSALIAAALDKNATPSTTTAPSENAPHVPTTDPIIEFLNSQDAEIEDMDMTETIAPTKVAPSNPTKPSATVQRPAPPQKPNLSSVPKDAPNAPTHLKAPSKPKKRF
jgi:hypothetical protein